MNKSGLKRKADMKAIQSLYRDGLLDDEMFRAARSLVQPESAWFDWVRVHLLFWGCALILSGVVFFFAYNWADMGKFHKFVVIQAGLLACIIGSYVSGINRITGKVLLLSASVLVGVVLAVYGQIYQTGADAFELFTGWALLIAGWVFISELSGLWMLWIVLLNTAVILYWLQVGRFVSTMTYEHLCLAVSAINGSALIFGEWGALKGIEWLKGSWHRTLWLIAGLTALSIPTFFLIVDMDHSRQTTFISALIWVLGVACGFYFYRHVKRDMASLALITMAVCAIVLTLIAKLMFDRTGDRTGSLLLYSLIVTAVVSGAVIWLRRMDTAMTNEKKEATP